MIDECSQGGVASRNGVENEMDGNRLWLECRQYQNETSRCHMVDHLVAQRLAHTAPHEPPASTAAPALFSTMRGWIATDTALLRDR